MFDASKLTRNDFIRAFEGMRSKNTGSFEHGLCDLMCHKADAVNAAILAAAYPHLFQDWLERADRLPNKGL
jgi:hypothetical protein